ncbi:MAG: hypothetical protein JY451_04210 [Erythrobacter sp.]|nr:MAG: hypothetical protein JY451_04210 [Erythrobacter sp.]
MTAGDSVENTGRVGSIFWIYHLSRLVFGGWWLFSGLMHFVWPELQPLGNEQPAIDFTLALMASGLFDVIKLLEVVLGLLILANRAMPLALLALVPINIVIVYWNFVLDEGLVEWTFGAMSILFNIILAWPWRRYFWPLFVWRGTADHSARPGIQDFRI